MFVGLHVKYPLFLSDFNETGIFSTDFRKILGYKFCENPSSGSRVVPCSRTGRRTDRRDEANSLAPTMVLLAFSVFMCFVLVSEQTGTLALYNIKLFFFYIRDEMCLLLGTNWAFK